MEGLYFLFMETYKHRLTCAHTQTASEYYGLCVLCESNILTINMLTIIHKRFNTFVKTRSAGLYHAYKNNVISSKK